MPLNANHCRSMPINSELIGIDQHRSELIDIGIDIDRHWALIKGVLNTQILLCPANVDNDVWMGYSFKVVRLVLS